VRSDVCGPMPKKSLNGAKYYVTFIDDYTRKTCVFFLKTKAEVFDKFLLFKSLAENHTGQRLKILRTDNGTEYSNSRFMKYLAENGIVHQTSVPYTPEQNGVSERANRTIGDKARTMLLDAGLPESFWAEAVNIAVYIMNRTPTRAFKNIIPVQKWSGNKVDLSNLRIFGCKAYKHVPDVKRSKWAQKSNPMIFVGYGEDSKAYRLIDLACPSIVQKACSVIFNENVMFKSDVRCGEETIPESVIQETEPIVSIVEQNAELSICSGNSLQDSGQCLNSGSDSSDESELESSDEEARDDEPEHEGREPVRRSERSSHPPIWMKGYVNLFSSMDYSSETEPVTYDQAMKSPEKSQWQSAVASELKSINDNTAWQIVERPTNRKVVKNRWVFKKKKD